MTTPQEPTEFPFDCLDKLIEEEQALPPIPDWPSIWTTSEDKSPNTLK